MKMEQTNDEANGPGSMGLGSYLSRPKQMRRGAQGSSRLRRPDEFRNPQEYLVWQREWLREETQRTNPRWKRVSGDVLWLVSYFPFYLLLCLTVFPFMLGWGAVEVAVSKIEMGRILKGGLCVASGTLGAAVVLWGMLWAFRVAPGWTGIILPLLGLFAYFGMKLRP